MKRLITILIIAGAAAAGMRPSAAVAEKIKLFTVYAEADDPFSAAFVPSGWIGDIRDISLTTDHRNAPHTGATCIEVVYRRSPAAQNGWAGVVWQHPENNWGGIKGAGLDLSATTCLTFWARGERGGERIEEFKVGGTKGPYPDSAEAKIGPVVLTDTWTRYVIDLKGKDLTHIIAGFVWAANLQGNPTGCVFYLDDIRFE